MPCLRILYQPPGCNRPMGALGRSVARGCVVSNMLHVYHDIAPKLPGNVVVAGGAVRDFLMKRTPKDYDMFILGVPRDEAEPEIIKAMSGFEPVKVIEGHSSEPYLVGTWRYRDSTVQVMVNPAASTGALLDTFDWNTALFAYDGDFHQRTRIEDIAPGKDLRLQTVTFPLSTLRRGFRFSERFKMVFPRDLIVSLCEQVVEKGGKVGATGAEPDMLSLAANVLVDDREGAS